MPRTTLRVEDGILEQVKALARQNGTTIQEELNRLLRTALADADVAVEPLRLPARKARPRGVDLADRETLMDLIGGE